MTTRTYQVQYLLTIDSNMLTLDVKADEMEYDEGVLTLFREGDEVAIFTRCVAVIISDWGKE